MLQIHPNARTTPAVRAEIARSGEPSGVLARRYGVSTETIRKWRKRGPEDCLDHSARPHRLPWKATEEERAVVCALRRATDFALDDLTFVVDPLPAAPQPRQRLAHPPRRGAEPRPPPPSGRPKRGQGRFREYDLGFVHIDIKHLPKLQTADGERRKRYLYVAIDRRSRSVHLAVKDDETEKSAIAFLREAAAAFPFRLTHVLTDNGSCFTPRFARACAELGAEYRHTRPRSPQTNGMVERFNGRVGSEVLGITIWSHRRPRAAAARLQRRLQRPPPARARRQDAGPGRRRAPQGPTKARQRQAARPRRTRGHRQGTPHRRSRQGGLATGHLASSQIAWRCRASVASRAARHRASGSPMGRCPTIRAMTPLPKRGRSAYPYRALAGTLSPPDQSPGGRMRRSSKAPVNRSLPKGCRSRTGPLSARHGPVPAGGREERFPPLRGAAVAWCRMRREA